MAPQGVSDEAAAVDSGSPGTSLPAHVRLIDAWRNIDALLAWSADEGRDDGGMPGLLDPEFDLALRAPSARQIVGTWQSVFRDEILLVGQTRDALVHGRRMALQQVTSVADIADRILVLLKERLTHGRDESSDAGPRSRSAVEPPSTDE